MKTSTPPSPIPINSAFRVHWDVVILFVLLLVFDTAVQVLFKVGVNTLGKFPTISMDAALRYVGHLLINAPVMLGIVCLLLAFFIWMAIIARVDLSLAHPVTCLVYGSVPICSALLLNEVLSLRQVIGVIFIVVGAYVTGLSDKGG
ncbi:Transporter [Gammaproteobacteria bacterium]